LKQAKSLLEVKNGDTFLDLTAKQVITMRKEFNTQVNFMLMNSFNTSKDTLEFLAKYPSLVEDPKIELMQNKVPKIDKKTLLPAEWSINPHLEWCPPGHGDLYTALYGSGKLDALLADGIKYMFVSNSDNLGATLDTGESNCLSLCIFQTSNRILSSCRPASLFRERQHALHDGVLHPHRGRQEGRPPGAASGGPAAHPARICSMCQGGRAYVPGHLSSQVLQHEQPVGASRPAEATHGLQGRLCAFADHPQW